MTVMAAMILVVVLSLGIFVSVPGVYETLTVTRHDPPRTLYQEEQVLLEHNQATPQRRNPVLAKALKANKGQPALSFASYYGSHMVLQQAPKAACVWGFANVSSVGQKVTVTLMSLDGSIIYQTMSSTVTKRSPTRATWFVKLRPVVAGGPYMLTAVCGASTISITDVLFGDVWICSGQSNMDFTVSQLKQYDLKTELKFADSYPMVRLFTILQATSNNPLLDIRTVLQPWSVASAAAINGGNWRYFSAVCWLYGRRLHESLGYPIGLVDSDYGGTPVKAWSGPDAIKACATSDDAQSSNKAEHTETLPETYLKFDSENSDVVDHWFGNVGTVWKDSILWNPMIHPLLNMTIYGVIWYQGEADSGSTIYSCRFPAMIKDWRQKFNEGSQGETDVEFPFGFVQLAPWNDTSHIGPFPSIRWQQTANIGYVPNPIMPRTFMAVAMDLPDFTSNFSSIHPQYKEPIADRLFLGGLAVAYGKRAIKFQGPMPTSYRLITSGQPTALQIEYDNGNTLLRVLNINGFEVCCYNKTSASCSELSSSWFPAPVTAHDPTSVTISAEACHNSPINMLRYAWSVSPCPLKHCAVYSVENFLPAPPFVLSGMFGRNGNDIPSTWTSFTLKGTKRKMESP